MLILSTWFATRRLLEMSGSWKREGWAWRIRLVRLLRKWGFGSTASATKQSFWNCMMVGFLPRLPGWNLAAKGC